MKFTTNEASSIYYTMDGSTPTTASHGVEAEPAARAAGSDRRSPPSTTLKWIAVDFKGNTSAVGSQVLGQTDTTAPVGGSVPATLALTLGAPATFGAFTPGVAKDYTAATTATVISSAGDATLSVADPSSTATGHLVNGAFALAQPLQGLGTSRRGPHRPPTSRSRSPSSSRSRPTSALRTGTYSKTLTFTLSTTTP